MFLSIVFLLNIIAFASAAHPSTINCSLHWFEQNVDHFAITTSATYLQRYYIYDKYWKKASQTDSPVFFYTGNEADVGLYVNNTGLIWENAEEFGALIVFAEHRYYGESQPNTTAASGYLYLTADQALADYAVLIDFLRQEYSAQNNAFITFGGSYGGKLSAWMRLKYPTAVQGAISASAPLLAFPGIVNPEWNSESYYRIISNSAAFYSENCAENIRNVFPIIDKLGQTPDGSKQLQTDLHLCATPESVDDQLMLKFFIRDAFDELAMGNYPFPSAYIAGTVEKPLPGWPLKQACSYLSSPLLFVNNHFNSSASSISSLLNGLRNSISVLYNASSDQTCYTLPEYPTPSTPAAPMDGIWDWQWCTERLPDSFWFSTDGMHDMFWYNPLNESLISQHCYDFWGINNSQRSHWISQQYGGRNLLNDASNIIFTSGSFDGWSSAGIATNITDKSLISILISEGAHHLDLMFSHPEDPPSVKIVRKFQLNTIKTWIKEYSPVKALAWGDLIS